MLKVKKSEDKKASPAKAGKPKPDKLKKVVKKPGLAKKIKEKTDGKVKKVKKAVKDGLVKAPKGGSPKVGEAKVEKKPMDEAKIAALRLKRKQKKLEKKLKKAALKKEAAQQNGAEKKKPQKKKKPVKKDADADASDSEEDESKSPAKDKAGTKEKHPRQLNPKQSVFVGNLPTNTKRNQLVKLFAKFGTILSIRFRTASGKVIFKHKARKESNSLNAYIAFESEESAAKALELNGFEFKSNHIRVTPTDPDEQQRDPKRTIVVGNLKHSATDERLREIFSSCGEIEYVRTIQDGDKGCKGVAFVCFKNPDAVGLALELKDTMVDERPINVERYQAKKAGAGSKAENGAPVKGKGMKLNKKAGGKGGPGKKVNGAPAKAFNKKSKKNAAGSPNKPGKPGKKAGPAPAAGGDDKAAEGKKKKAEFRGVKTTIVKKKQKKVPSAMKKLADKIAPKGGD